jgi:N-acetylmuramoyl-L-alanine amidase
MTQVETLPREGTPKKAAKKPSPALPVLMILAALALFAMFALFLRAVLSGEWPAAKSAKAEKPQVILLDDGWVHEITADATRRGMEAAIDASLDKVAAAGSNAVALTGCTARGEALFQDGTDTLKTTSAVAQAGGRFAPFDAVQYLVRQASARGIQVYLTPSDGSGAALDANSFDALPAWAQKLAEKHGLSLLAEAQGNADDASALTKVYMVKEQTAVLLRADGNPALLASAVQNASEGSVAGVVLGSYSTLLTDTTDVDIFHAYLAGGALPDLSAYQDGKTIAETLAVTYPAEDGATVATNSLFLMGTSDPAESLTMNGSEIARYGTKGVWGVLLPLNLGANAFQLQNGAAALTYTVNYAKASGGGSASPQADGTMGAEAVGKKVQITDAIASALQNPGNSGSIDETLFQGAVAEITGISTYTSGSKITHAYQLSTGDYIRAATCQVIDAPDAAFTGAALREDADTNCTVLDFAGSGTPAVYHTWEGNTLTLTFLSAQYNGEMPTGGLVQGFAVQNNEKSFTLTLTFGDDNPLYGWAVNYDAEANTTSIWLKAVPHLSDAASGPLTGVTVMLDAGHGGDEKGAVGSAGTAAPVEKELNLSAAQAAKYRLEQLGATVILTRGEDTTLSLGDRVTAMNVQHPDFFISVHHNSVELTSDVNQSTGTEAYWFYDEGGTLAENLVADVCTATGRQNRGNKYGYYYVTRSNICPATLLELGFVTNPAEYERCTASDTLWAEGGAIAQAIYNTVAANG